MKIIPLFALLFLTNSNSIAQTGSVSGHIILNSNGDSTIIREHVMVWLKHDGEKWWITGLDSNFNFCFDTYTLNLKPDTTEIRITTVNRYLDTIVKNVIIAEGKETYLEISYPPACEFYKTENDSICPVCKKHDQVIPIIYGPYSSSPKRRKNKEKYLAERHWESGCDPNWYCRRNDIKF